jgi:hypothetical protein
VLYILVLTILPQDERWYRAKILREIALKGKDPKYEVFFVDYGNFDTVNYNVYSNN